MNCQYMDVQRAEATALKVPRPRSVLDDISKLQKYLKPLGVTKVGVEAQTKHVQASPGDQALFDQA